MDIFGRKRIAELEKDLEVAKQEKQKAEPLCKFEVTLHSGSCFAVRARRFVPSSEGCLFYETDRSYQAYGRYFTPMVREGKLVAFVPAHQIQSVVQKEEATS